MAVRQSAHAAKSVELLAIELSRNAVLTQWPQAKKIPGMPGIIYIV